MSVERFQDLVRALCHTVGMPDPNSVLARGALEVDGFEVALNHYESDPGAMYLNFSFGIVTAGRTLRVFRLILEANLNVYAQDQAQFGLEPDTGGILLIVRAPLTDDVDGSWLADTIHHYIEHGRYWRENILGATDDMFDALSTGEYTWLRA